MGTMSEAMAEAQAPFPIRLEHWRHTALAPPVRVLRWAPGASGGDGSPAMGTATVRAARHGQLDALVTWVELEVAPGEWLTRAPGVSALPAAAALPAELASRCRVAPPLIEPQA
eukprot:5904760-Prymnesium_polylepis.1